MTPTVIELIALGFIVGGFGTLIGAGGGYYNGAGTCFIISGYEARSYSQFTIHYFTGVRHFKSV